jgi:hypothetical protein
MRKSGRKAWSADDHDHAARVTGDILGKLGFDVVGWAATAGAPRNEPDAQPLRRTAKRRQRDRPVQLSFAFA